MDIMQKAKLLGDAGHFDSCGPKQCEIKVKNSLSGLYHAESENRNCVMLKTLMSSSCTYDCKYCPNSTRSREKNPVEYTPEELAKLFNYTRTKLNTNGLFLSSGVTNNPDVAMEKMIDAVKIVRKTFNGYVHMKILPGASLDKVKQAAELSDRLSINIETPNSSTLKEMSDCKDYKADILRRQAWISKMRISQSTQMIVSSHSTDKEVLSMTSWEYDSLKVSRVYYSAFQPVKNTVMENERPESYNRQNRLYNADFLLNKYGFQKKEIFSIMDDGMLPRGDPKLAIAMANNEHIDVNEATYDELIRIPGIGPKTAQMIIARRKAEKITRYSQLEFMGSLLERSKPFMDVGGRRQALLSEF